MCVRERESQTETGRKPVRVGEAAPGAQGGRPARAAALDPRSPALAPVQGPVKERWCVCERVLSK